MSRNVKRLRSLVITVIAIAAANVAVTYASGVTIPIGDAPRPKKTGVTIPIGDAPRPKTGVTIPIGDAPRPKTGVTIPIGDAPRP